MNIQLVKERIKHPMTRGIEYVYSTYVNGNEIPESWADDLEEAKEKYDSIVKSGGTWPKNIIISTEV